MTSINIWLKELLTQPSTPLYNLVGDRVYPRESFDSSVIGKPYLVFGLGNSTNDDIAEEDYLAERQFFQIWVHDEMTEYGGSYLKINQIIPLVKQRLIGAKSPAQGIITTKYLETSGEFSQQTMGTIFKYVRFQSIIGKAM